MIRDLILLFVIIGIHLLALYWLADAGRLPASRVNAEQISQVLFIAGKPRRLSAPAPKHSDARPVPAAKPATRPASNPPTEVPALPENDDRPLRVIGMDGRIVIPEAALDAFLQGAENKSFEIGRAGQNDMRDLLKRPVALEYRPTRFDEHWQGDVPALERVLETALEKTTATVKIPIPGRPGAYLECKIMVLAAGGGCGFTANDDGYYVRLDDPDTLSAEEDRQCQAWWDLIVSAKTQGEWRRTRTLYDRECRKPLATQP